MDVSDNGFLQQLDEFLSRPNQSWLLGAGISKDAGIPLMYPLTARVMDLAKGSAHKPLLDALVSELPAGSHVEHLLSHLGDYTTLGKRNSAGKVSVGGIEYLVQALEAAHVEVLGHIAETARWGYQASHDGLPETVGSLAIGKTEFEATSQNNVIYKALTHARMVAAGLVEPSPSAYGAPAPTDGGNPDDPRPKAGVNAQLLVEFDRDKPRPFSLDELVNHITYLQGARPKVAVLEQIPAGDFTKNFKSILDKLAILRRDPRIHFLMANWGANAPTLPELLGQFVGAMSAAADELKDIRILDISGLPNEVAGPLAAMLARLLFQYKLYQSEDERTKDPVLLVCEEAHRYVPDRGEAEYAAAQMAIRRIAREGRKYGLGLMLVSQRPADIESTVISQCGTWLVLRLTNQADQQHVARFLPDGLSGMTKALPNLAQQEAIFVGEGAALPARVRIRNLANEQLPRSQSAKFSAGWAGPRLTPAELQQVANRMVG